MGIGTADRSPDVELHTEWGYRLPDGREVWENDYGTDGRWTPYLEAEGILNIDVDDRTTAADVARVLAGRGVVLSRLVTITRGPVEEHPEAGDA